MTDQKQMWVEGAGWSGEAQRYSGMWRGRRLFKKDAAPAPKPDPLIGQAAAQNVELGREQLQLARDQYNDNKARQDQYDALTGKVAQSALDTQNLANQWAQQDRDIQTKQRDKYDNWANEDRQLGRDTKSLDDKLAQQALDSGKQYASQFQKLADQQNALGSSQVSRYQSTFAPVENKVASEAMNWDSADRQAAMASEAKADAVAAGQQARDATSRSLASMGVNPNSGKFAATTGANDTAVALAGAGAQNAARNNVRLQGVQLRQQAAQLGQQVLSSGQQANSLGLQATGAAQTAEMNGTNTALAAQNQGLAAAGIGNTTASLAAGQQGAGYAGLGTGLSAGGAATSAAGAANANNFATNSALMNGFTGAINANASGAGIANAAYGNQLNAWGMQQQANATNAAGLGSLAGSLAGTGAALYL